MTQEEAAELLDIFRSDNCEAPLVDPLKLVELYIALLEGAGVDKFAESARRT